MARSKPGIASGIGDADYGRIALAFVAILVLVPLITALVIYYVAEYGNLPFTFRPGPLGITPWEPVVVLFVALVALVAMPIAWHRIAPAGDTFYAQAAENRRNSVFLSAAIIVGLALTAYIVAIVVSLRTSVALGVAAGAVAIGAASAVAAFRIGDRALLRLSSARPLRPDDGSPSRTWSGSSRSPRTSPRRGCSWSRRRRRTPSPPGAIPRMPCSW